MRRIFAGVAAILMLTRQAGAQATPEAAAAAFGSAVKANDWAGAARLMHPDALRQLREVFAPLMGAPEAGQIGSQLFGVGSAAELASTPDTVMFAHFLKAMLEQDADLAQVLKTATTTPLGHVTTSGDTVLVVSRMAMRVQGVVITSYEVMPFLLYRGGYRGLLKADFTNMATMLKARFAKPS